MPGWCTQSRAAVLNRNVILPLVTVALVILVISTSAFAQKTSEILAVSGTQTVERWDASHRVHFADGDWYAAFGTIGCSIRSQQSGPVKVLLWGRGDIFFFDPSSLPVKANGPWPAPTPAWASILISLKSDKKGGPVYRTDIVNSNAPQYLGYLIRVPAGTSDKAAAKIFVGVEGAEPEEIPISIEVVQNSLWPVLPTLTASLAGTVVGAVVGALIGMATFRWQQKVQQKQEQSKHFYERKVENSTKLWRFFQETYPVLVSGHGRSDLERVQDVRKTMLEEGVYAILLPETAAKVNRFCDGTMDSTERVNALREALREYFPEFMRP